MLMILSSRGKKNNLAKLQKTLISFYMLLFSNTILSNEYNTSCEQLLNQKQYEKALRYANNAKKINKSNYKITFCRGQANLNLKNFDNAFLDFEESNKLAINETDRSISILLAATSLRAGNRPEEAISLSRSFIASIRNNFAFKRLFLNEIAESLLLLRKFDEAAATFLEAYNLASNINERAANLDRAAFTYASLKNFTKAIEFGLKANLAFEQTSSLEAYAESGISLGLYYLENNDLDSAERTFFKFDKLFRESGDMYYLAKVLYAESKYYKKISNVVLSNIKLNEANKIADDIEAEDLKILFKGD